MKKTTPIYMAALLGMVLAAPLTSCDDVDADDRYIQVEQIEPQRAVLLEEFTGQFCVNCPKGHETIEQLKEQYGDKLIAVSIHAGGDAFSIGEGQIDGVVGLRLDEGEQYAAAYSVKSYPSAIADRVGGISPTVGEWATLVRNEMSKESTVELELSAEIADAPGSAIAITTTLKPTADFAGKLQLWIVESGIKAWQLQLNGSMELEYEHNHVFRGSVNGHDGETVKLSKNIFTALTHTQTVKDNWNPSNLSVVAFIYNDNGVMQAAECRVEIEQWAD